MMGIRRKKGRATFLCGEGKPLKYCKFMPVPRRMASRRCRRMPARSFSIRERNSLFVNDDDPVTSLTPRQSEEAKFAFR
jgi:hypothetical protein